MAMDLHLALAAALTTARPSPTPLPCQAEQMSLAFDGEGGAFDAMSHSGALLVLRNLGPQACVMAGLPILTLRDAQGRTLPVVRVSPAGMHPGPAMRPVGVAAGAELTAPLRWVSGEVFDHSRCVSPASARVSLSDGAVAGPFRGRLCGPRAGAVTFEQPPLRPDPRLEVGDAPSAGER